MCWHEYNGEQTGYGTSGQSEVEMHKHDFIRSGSRKAMMALMDHVVSEHKRQTEDKYDWLDEAITEAWVAHLASQPPPWETVTRPRRKLIGRWSTQVW